VSLGPAVVLLVASAMLLAGSFIALSVEDAGEVLLRSSGRCSLRDQRA
jgi:hypothetical protein